jgi:hypothetical protein
MKYFLVLILVLFVGCSGLPGASGEQELAITPEVTVTTAPIAATDSDVKITTETETVTIQEQDISSGAKVKADIVESITTENYAGIPVWWFMVGCLIFGLIMPQPFFIRWMF